VEDTAPRHAVLGLRSDVCRGDRVAAYSDAHARACLEHSVKAEYVDDGTDRVNEEEKKKISCREIILGAIVALVDDLAKPERSSGDCPPVSF
jgi:hypothetical protein